MRYLQSARAEQAPSRRRALYHRGLFRLLGDALSRSATLLTKKDMEQLSTVKSQLSTEFHMYPDRDEPGERLFMQLQKVLPNLEHHQLPPGCKDFSDYYLSITK